MPWVGFEPPCQRSSERRQLQLLNLWLLNVMLRCVNDGVTTIKPGHRTNGNARVIWSDESPFTLFPTTGRVCVLRNPGKLTECLVPTVKHGEVLWWFGQQYRGTVFCWFHYYPSWPNYLLQGNTWDRFGNQARPINQTLFLNNDAVFQDNTTIHTAGIIQSRLEEHEDEFQHLLWPAQSSDLNITEPLWSDLETRVRNRLPPLTSLKQFKNLKTNGIKFRQWLFRTCTGPFQEGLRLCWRQKLVQHHIHKEMCIVFVVFPLFCATPVSWLWKACKIR
jgi:hypothetical protein